MKSLDIVNRKIESTHNQLNDYDEDDEEYGFYPSYDTLIYILNELEIIKQDLEALEIYKKYFTPDYIQIYTWEGEERGKFEYTGTDFISQVYEEDMEKFKKFYEWWKREGLDEQ